MCVSKKGVPRMLYLIFATAKGIVNCLELWLKAMLQVRLTLKRIGTCDLLATIMDLFVFCVKSGEQ